MRVFRLVLAAALALPTSAALAQEPDEAEPLPSADEPAATEVIALPLDTKVAPTADAPPVAEGLIARIDVTGNRRIEEAAVLAAMALRQGDRLSRDTVRRDIEAIYGTGFFRDVVMDVAPSVEGEGIVLTVQVVENPAVREVTLEGNKRIDEDDIREVLDIAPFSVLNDADIAANRQRIRELYLEKGYFLAEILPEVRPVSDGQVTVNFSITENRKVVVQSVDITGNDHVVDRKIVRYMGTRAGGIAPWLTSTGTFRREDLENDMFIVRSVFLEEGFVDIQVGDPKVYLSPDKRYIYVTIHVEEGVQYDLGEIAAQGDWVPEEGLTDEAVMRIVDGESVIDVQGDEATPLTRFGRLFDFSEGHIPLRRGDTFKLSQIQETMQRISDLYGDEGYAFVSVVPLTETRPDDAEVDIAFDITKGEKYRIGRIDITGNDPTWDKVVRREIPINEGEIYRVSHIREARARLERLGFFEEIRISNPRGDGDDVLDMKVEVVEQPTGSFSLGAGFSSLENFVLTGSVSKNNFLGLGYAMSAAINWSSLRQQGNLSLADPHFLDTRWTLKVDAYSISEQLAEDQITRGGGLAVGRYLDQREDLRLTMSYTLEDMGLTSITAYQERLLGGQMYRSGLTSTLGLNLYIDKRNNRINATRGFYASLSTAVSGGVPIDDQLFRPLGGDFNLWENKANVRIYRPIIPEKDWLIFRLNSTVGHIRSTDGSVVPYIHRYRAGGINSVRGYNWYSLGPTLRNVGSEEPGRADDRLLIGGTSTWINNLEIEAPIVKQAGISAVIFFDAGNAFGDAWGDGGIRVEGLRLAYGGGIRWLSPIGPLRFELGFPINRYPDERASVFDFSIGSFF